MLQLIVIVWAIIMLSKEPKLKKMRQESSNWPKVKGKITVLKKRLLGIPKVTYHYEIEGMPKNASTILFSQSMTRAMVKDLRKRYKPGDEVDVYYDPKNPLTAVLIPGEIEGSKKASQLAIAFLVIIAVTILLQVATMNSRGIY